MTRQCNDPEKATEFSNWLRSRELLQSKGKGKAYSASNLDYIWEEYKSGKYILVEEKRCMSELTFPQSALLAKLHKALKNDAKYFGFFLIQFENLSPSDGFSLVSRCKLDHVGCLVKAKTIQKTEAELEAFMTLDWAQPKMQRTAPPRINRADEKEAIIKSRHD